MSNNQDNSDCFYALRRDYLEENIGTDTFNLSNINDFTMKFSDYDDLFNYFLEKNLVHKEIRGKDFVIVYKYNGKYRILNYGIAYNCDKKYFKDISFNNEYFADWYLLWSLKAHHTDTDFLIKLCNEYHHKMPKSKDQFFKHPYFAQ